MVLPVKNKPQDKGIELTRYHAHQRHALRNMTFLRPGFCLVLRGTKIMDLPGGKCSAGSNSLIFYAPHEHIPMQHIPDDSGYEALVVSFSASALAEFNARYRDVTAACRLITTTAPVPLSPDIHEAWQRLIRAASVGEPAPLLNYHLEGVLLRLALAGYSVAAKAPLFTLSQQITAHIAEDPAVPHTLEHFAQRLGLSLSTLNRRIKAEGQSFRQLQEDVRLSLAMEYVQTTDTPLGRIAEQVGYASLSRFISRFRLRYSLTPGALRKAIHGPK
ncbi:MULTISPECIES: helix-turn-helix domain-containing protein [Enterobacteriaceae]|uniref:helix-turn-helix transcriptional regulator n=1 Tax=Enterobacteriaceae TaxID=543 RepID=UPI000272A506|nr:helix-turn-helix domain-containing protein [Enterobacter sp. Ag1]EJF30346.1 Transcriptional regulator, AraC/XylS family protein [Enterobacter sp. Ag1]